MMLLVRTLLRSIVGQSNVRQLLEQARDDDIAALVNALLEELEKIRPGIRNLIIERISRHS